MSRRNRERRAAQRNRPVSRPAPPTAGHTYTVTYPVSGWCVIVSGTLYVGTMPGIAHPVVLIDPGAPAAIFAPDPRVTITDETGKTVYDGSDISLD